MSLGGARRAGDVGLVLDTYCGRIADFGEMSRSVRETRRGGTGRGALLPDDRQHRHDDRTPADHWYDPPLRKLRGIESRGGMDDGGVAAEYSLTPAGLHASPFI